jgi:hypothetical protein
VKSNIIDFGDIGTGKSRAIRTLLSEYPDETGKIHKGAGLKVHLLACEPGWEATNGDLTCDLGFHVHQVLPANPSWKVKIAWLEKISNMSAEDVKKMPIPSSIRNGYRQFMELHVACLNFTCHRCGEDLGGTDDWGEDIAFVNDGLTGITKMATHNAVGPKPTLTWPEIDLVAHSIEDYVNKCCAAKCTYLLIAHWDRVVNQIEGGTEITINTIGNKLAPRLLLDTFDEIILSERSGNIYTWNLADDKVRQKARRLEYKAGLRPDFSQIFRDT